MQRKRPFRRVTVAVMVLALAQVVCAAAPPYYAKKDTWHETLRVAREALVAFEAEQADAPDDEGLAGLSPGPWYMAGPFYLDGGRKRAFDHAFPPEKGVDLARPMGEVRWQARPQFSDGMVHGLQAGSNGVTYLYRTIQAARPKKITGYFGSDDGMKAWLNGEEIISHDVPRGPAPNQDKAVLALRKGENHLLLKIHNNGGGHGFYFSLTGRARSKDPARERRDELWELVQKDFQSPDDRRHIRWEHDDAIWNADWKAGDVRDLAARYVRATRIPRLQDEAKARAAAVAKPADLAAVRGLYYRSRGLEETLARGRSLDLEALRLAIDDLIATHGPAYAKGREYLARLDALQQRLVEAQEAEKGGDAAAKERLLQATQGLLALRREALLANPLLDFRDLIFIRRGEASRNLGLPQNWQGNTAVSKNGYDNEIAVVSMRDPEGPARTLYRPQKGEFVGDVELHWDADRFLFSMPNTENGTWQVWEIGADGKGLRQVTPGEHPDVDNYDACYLPDGRIIYCSTVGYQGVPCVGGGNKVGNLCIMNADGTGVRRLTFDQDHSWCPTVLNSGRVAYARWEYSDTPHYFSRLLFEMNPDGTSQFELYGSNSYWPNSMFYARPVPGHPTKIATIISGHHGVPRMGELLILDPAKGKHEADGVVQRIPGYGEKVEPVIQDQLVNGSWPKFLHPWPLSEKYFLVACQMDNRSPWALYLVDVFDNMVLLRSEPGYALLEPVPLAKRPTPPAIPDRVDLARKDAIVYMANVYRGDGLKGVPKGTVKALRVFTNHYGYRGMGGHINIGIDGPWDVKRILGTVPVNPDGSAMFRVPANRPIVVEPLDAEGNALQVMRSWYTAMPGEVASCVGCHERQAERPPLQNTMATHKPPSEIAPWYGPPRGFSFKREVQPVVDRYCVSCHNGERRADGKMPPDLRRADQQPGYKGRWTPAYEVLHRFVRRPGPESDYHMMPPLEYHPDTSELVQMLKKGHGGVDLDAEAWDRLLTWIDLNVPCHGTWSEHRRISGDGQKRRAELFKQYAGLDLDPEVIPGEAEPKPVAPLPPKPPRNPLVRTVACAGWPFDAAEARRRQGEADAATQTIDLGEGVTLDLVRVPAGAFVMGDADGWPDEWPVHAVRIEKAFWMGRFEVTNAQYARFDPSHDSRYISWFNKDQNRRGEPANGPKQPVIRVAWSEAMAFCRWLSEQTGRHFTLPTEAQWEYACRAGTATPLWYGPAEADFAKAANFADSRLNSLTRRDSPRWIPTIDAVNDGDIVTSNYDKHQPNPWGLADMHGNVCEWTRSLYRPYPYAAGDGRDDPAAEGMRVVRGGSFYDRPARGRSAFRWRYRPWQKVFNVGFRVMTEDEPAGRVASAGAE
jgi:formylglycine-generating enzyme required for sulfatase activity